MHDEFAQPAKTLTLLQKLSEMGFSDSAFCILHHFTSPTTIASHRAYCEGLVREGGTFRTSSNRLVQRRLEMVLRMCKAAGIERPTGSQFEHLAHVALLELPHDRRRLNEQYAENTKGAGGAV